MKYSFLIAAYNEERYIKECIQSCLHQKGIEEHQVEIICVDDGSTDKTYEIIKSLEKLDSRITIDHFITNRGKVAAFNRAYELSSGDIIGLIGADDIAMPNRVSDNFYIFNKTDVAMTVGSMVAFYEENNMSYIREAPRIVKTLERALWSNSYGGGLISIQRQFAAKVFPIPIELPFEDWWIEIIAVYNKIRVARIEKPILIYRIHSENDSISHGSILNSIRKDWKRHKAYYDFILNKIENADCFDNRQYFIRLIKKLSYFKENCSYCNNTTRLVLIAEIISLFIRSYKTVQETYIIFFQLLHYFCLSLFNKEQ